jgi:hypothetical protein
VKLASAACGLAAVAVVIKAANLASQAYGVTAGAAVIVTVFAACWIFHRVRPALHPVRRPRASIPHQPVMDDCETPARIAA